MLFKSTFALAALVALTSAQTLHATQPRFPPSCPAPDGKEQFYLADHHNQLLSNPKLCHRVGQTCMADSGCKRPTTKECAALRPADYDGKIYPAASKCVDGVCRFAAGLLEDECDCLQGCGTQTPNDSTPLYCHKGKCVPTPCTPCYEKPVDGRRCCGGGIVTGLSDGKCACDVGIGGSSTCSTQPQKCSSGMYDDVCCAKGTKNDGRCCEESSCNGRCVRQPK